MSGASAQSVLPTPDGGVVVLGITTVNLSMNLSDVWLFKVNANGDTLWSRSFGGGNEDYGRVIAPTSDGGFIIGAETESYGSGGSDIWLIKTDASGNLVPLK
jgi:predicted secreted protein